MNEGGQKDERKAAIKLRSNERRRAKGDEKDRDKITEQ